MSDGERTNDGETHRRGDALTELAKRRGFFFASNEIYGGTAGFYTWGPLGTALKRHIEDAWRDRFTVRENNREIESPTIMPAVVFEASSHLEGFTDMLVSCPNCGESHRADHVIERETDVEDAESYTMADIEKILRTAAITCPSCDYSLTDEPVEEFNLMFETAIGPGSGDTAYLRPETAQGIFVEFPLLAEYGRQQLPLGVTQIGPAYRNEISPRKSVIRVREFTQAELELFIDPTGDRPNLEPIADVDLPLYPAGDQRDPSASVRRVSVESAVESGIVANDWIAYYLGIGMRWFERIGIDRDRFRFRQHLEGERAHYASDCWDAEAELDGSWVELAGFAYRGAYDLGKHASTADADFSVFKPFDEPISQERATVDPQMDVLGPTYGREAARIAERLHELVDDDPSAFAAEDVTISIDGDDFTIPVDLTGFEVETVITSGEHFTPHVVEPSFGIGRIVYTVMDHAYRRDVVDAEARTVLRLQPEVAPYTVGILPLQARDGLDVRAREIAEHLRESGLEVTADTTGNIGRRYRRLDEIGTPFCVTVDYETLESDPETVTLRDRDSTDQIRLEVDDLRDVLIGLRDGDLRFDALRNRYGRLAETDRKEEP